MRKVESRDALIPNQIQAVTEIYGFLLILSDCCSIVCGLLVEAGGTWLKLDAFAVTKLSTLRKMPTSKQV
jgi:hypothetical protein